MKQIKYLNKSISSRSGYWQILSLFALSTIVLLWKLGARSLKDWDEAIYAQISKEIVQNGDWLTLHWGYSPWFHKPPLFMWTTAVFYQIFEVNEFWARAASAFSGIGVVVLTYLLGRLAYNESTGFFAAIVLLTSYPFVGYSRFGTTDIMLTLFVYLAFYAYLKLEKKQQKWWYLVWVSCGLAFMTKGIAGLIAPIIIFFTLLLERNLSLAIKSKYFWQGLILAFILVLPWHFALYLKYGQTFLSQYLGYHVIVRSVKSIEGHSGGYLYYIWELNKHFFPWFYLTFFALAVSVKEYLKSNKKTLIFLVTFAIIIGIYTIAKTKLAWYIVPIYPGLAIFIGLTINKALSSRFSLAFVGLALVSLVVICVTPFKVAFLSTNSKTVLAMVGLLLLITILALAVARKISYQLSVVFMCAVLLLSGIREIRGLYPSRQESVAKLASLVSSKNVGSKEPLLVVKLSSNLYRPTALFYSNRPVLWVKEEKELRKLTHQEKREAILAQKDILQISQNYEINVLLKSDDLVYAAIKKN